jgi:tetratricopeptide (TPR) repeat protein
MGVEICEIERYITDNINIDINYLKELTNQKDGGIKLRIYYIYGLFKTNHLKLAKDELKLLNESESLEKNSFFLMVQSLVQISNENEIDLLIKTLENYLVIDKKKDNKWLRLELYKLYEKKEIHYLAWGFLEDAVSIDENFYEAILLRTQKLDLITNCSDIVNQLLQLPQSYNNSDVLNFLGNAFLNFNEIDNALKIFNGSLEIGVTEEAQYFIGYINHYYLNDKENAMMYYNKSIVTNNQFIDALLEKAWLFFDMKLYESSENLFKEILDSHDEVNTYNQLTLFYLKIGKYIEALNYIEKSKNKFGKNHMNQGFELVYLQKVKNESYVEKYHFYKKKYSDNQLLWFKSLLSEL